MSSAPGYKVKVLLAGPSKTGKTAIANFLADATEVSGMDTDYWPTHVVRILEFEQVQKHSLLKLFAKRIKPKGRSQKVNILNRHVNVEVELWDTSGNVKFQSMWPALSHEANGIVFVFNPGTAHPNGQN